jgi:hypothetical protein
MDIRALAMAVATAGIAETVAATLPPDDPWQEDLRAIRASADGVVLVHLMQGFDAALRRMHEVDVEEQRAGAPAAENAVRRTRRARFRSTSCTR